ncbi:MAG: class I SAM-dependent methyltransferase [Methylophilus sp.]|nr:class I SAM-dependent methyltransferase [Methylophilus sp.]
MMFNHPFRINQRVVAFGALMRASKKITRIPSVQALLVQCVALAVVLACASEIYRSVSLHLQVDVGFILFSLIIMQSVLSSAIAYSLKMAIWWRWIHFFFPIALWLMSIAHIPNTFYLVGFVVTLALYWTTFKTQVPFYPSHPAVWKALLSLIQKEYQIKALRVIDIGSGLGDMSMYLAQSRKQDTVEGIEIAPLPWLISRLRARLKQSTATFTLGNYEALNFAAYDVVFAYLSPAAMPRLWQKATQEMRSGSLLVSLEFEILNVSPTYIIYTGLHSPQLYVWRMA